MVYFSQIYGLGKTIVSELYAIKSIEEAKDCFNHIILGNRLVEITEEFLSTTYKTESDILGNSDDMKLISSFTIISQHSK